MGGLAIDLDRGVTIRSDQKTGTDVYMYKDAPGVFLNAYGHEVDVTLAKRAGFDTKVLVAEREKRAAKSAALAAIEAEFQARHRTDQKVVEEVAGYKLLHYGQNRFGVIGPDGKAVNDNKKFLTKKEAQTLMQAMVGAVEQAAAQEEKAAAEVAAEKSPTS